MNRFLKLAVLVSVLIGIGVHIYSLVFTAFPFTEESTWSHYAHLVCYLIILYAVLKLHAQPIGKILYALAIIYPVYYHAKHLLGELNGDFGAINYQNVVACVAIIVFLPWGITLFKKYDG